MKIAALDIGGSAIKSAVIEVTNPTDITTYKVCSSSAIPTEAEKGTERILSNIVVSATKALQFSDVPLLCVSSAGRIDWDTGRVTYATEALPGFTGLRLSEYLRKICGVKTVVENDATSHLIGETFFGRFEDKSVLALTLGTGLGASIMKKSFPLNKDSVENLELAHVTLHEGGRPCACGKRGCIEQYVSATGLKENNGGKLLEGNSEAERKALKSFYADFLEALNIAEKEYLPDVIIVGGGITEKNVYDFDVVKKLFAENGGKAELVKARLNNSAGLVGIVYAAQNGVFALQ